MVGNFDPPYAGGTSIDNLVTQTNPDLAEDVNADGHVTGLDALLIINELNRIGPQEMTRQLASKTAAPYLDVNGDGYMTGVDALWVINYLNAQSRAAAESAGGSSTPLRMASNVADDPESAAASSPMTSDAAGIGAAMAIDAAAASTDASAADSQRSNAAIAQALPGYLLLSSTPSRSSGSTNTSGGQFEGVETARRAKGDGVPRIGSSSPRMMHALVDDRLARLGSGRVRVRPDEASHWREVDADAAASEIARHVARASRRQSAKDAVFADLM